MNKQDMYKDVGTRPKVDIWNIEKVLSMQTDPVTKDELSCSLEDCGTNWNRIVGPLLMVVGVLCIYFGVTA
jgi:hypothetical protein